MADSTILTCWGGTYLAGDTANFNNRRWYADTPETLIAKLDAEGIDRSRLRLDKWEDGPHDHALAPHAVAAFIAILGVNPNLNPQIAQDRIGEL